MSLGLPEVVTSYNDKVQEKDPTKAKSYKKTQEVTI